MARKQYNFKFDEDEVARWDDWAESQGLSRTTFIETAAERMITAAGVPPTEAKRSPEAKSETAHAPRPGIRRAYICKKDVLAQGNG